MKCRLAQLSDLDNISNLLAREFFDDPAYKLVFSERKERIDVMKAYFHLYGNLAIQRGGIITSEDNHGALVYFRPNGLEMTEKEKTHLYQQLYDICGTDYTSAIALIEGLENLQPLDPPHYFIALLAVQRETRGGNIVRSLIKELNTRLDKEKFPCYAECTRYSTRTLLRRWGYRDAGAPLCVEGFPALFPIWRDPK